MLCNRPTAEVCEELREGGGQVVGVQSAGVGKNPSVAAAEELLLEADSGVSYTRDDAVGVNAYKGDDGWTPAPDFRQEAPSAGAQLVVGEFIRARGGAIDDVGDAELEVEQKRFFKRGEKTRSEPAAVQGGPKAVARAAEVAADGGGVEAGIDAREEHDEVFGCEIRYALVARSEDLAFAGFPGSDRCPVHMAASSVSSSVTESTVKKPALPGRALTVREVCALSDLDNISVRIADVAARLAVLGDRFRDEFRSSTFP